MNQEAQVPWAPEYCQYRIEECEAELKMLGNMIPRQSDPCTVVNINERIVFVEGQRQRWAKALEGGT